MKYIVILIVSMSIFIFMGIVVKLMVSFKKHKHCIILEFDNEQDLQKFQRYLLDYKTDWRTERTSIDPIIKVSKR